MAVIIVEGVDGSGKTTLIRNLRQETKHYFWIASSSKRPQTPHELQDAIHWIGQATYLKLPIVCDRFPVISESVYGPILRGTNLLDQLSRRDQVSATTVLQEVDRIIYCRPPRETVKTAMQSNPQLEGVREKLNQLYDRYDEIMDSLRDDNSYVITYDYTKKYSIPLDGLVFGRI